MKTPLVIIIVLVVAILGFLTIYSQQHDMAAQTQGEGGAAGGGYGSAAPAGGGYGAAAPAAGGYGGAPAEGHGSAPAAGGYGAAPSSGGYGK